MVVSAFGYCSARSWRYVIPKWHDISTQWYCVAWLVTSYSVVSIDLSSSSSVSWSSCSKSSPSLSVFSFTSTKSSLICSNNGSSSHPLWLKSYRLENGKLDTSYIWDVHIMLARQGEIEVDLVTQRPFGLAGSYSMAHIIQIKQLQPFLHIG